MKKRIIFLIFILTIFVVLLFNVKISTKKEEVAYKVTLDINPSMEINLDKDKNVLNIRALNDDAKEIIDDNLKGENIDDVIVKITDKVIEKGYVTNDSVAIIIYSKDTDLAYDVQQKVADSFEEKNVFPDIILIEEINYEDEEIAREYGISPAKASYINAISKDINDIDIEELTEKSVKELVETKRTGNYCDAGYTLEGDFCIKEIDIVDAIDGLVCSTGYYEYNGECYLETNVIHTDKKECPKEFNLEDDKCVREWTSNARALGYKCETGTLVKRSEVALPDDSNGEDGYVCIDEATAIKPQLKCMMSSEHIVIDGKCYNGPAPLIDGGCPGSDLPISDGCYSLDDEDQWQCPSGRIYHASRGGVPMYCPDSLNYTDAIAEKYECNEHGVLNGNMCEYKETIDPMYAMECPEGFNLVDNDRCINLNNKIDKQDGYVCEQDNSRVEGNKCIILDIKNAYHN